MSGIVSTQNGHQRDCGKIADISFGFLEIQTTTAFLEL